MRLCVIDGRGSGHLKELIQRSRTQLKGAHETVALELMQAQAGRCGKRRLVAGGTGEQAIEQRVLRVDIILASFNLVLRGPCGVTPGLAGAILDAPGGKRLLPLNRAQVRVMGAEALTLKHLIGRAIGRVQALLTSSASA